MIEKSNSYVEYQLIHIQKRNIVIINVFRSADCHAEKFINPLSELRTKLIEIGNRTPNIIFRGDLNFPIIGRQIMHRNNAYINIQTSHREKIIYSMTFSLITTNSPYK